TKGGLHPHKAKEGLRPHKAKEGLHPHKVLLFLRWDMKGMLHFELINPTKRQQRRYTVSSLSGFSQRDSYKTSIFGCLDEKCSCIKTTLGHIKQGSHYKGWREWETMLHPPYSPDIAPCDYHLFRSLRNHLDGKNMISLNEVRKVLEAYFSLPTSEFR
ncbi:hypothetical protein AVEN_73284-1, partial [Araneus ventricosus]